jgi:hypothetical protein
MEKKLFKNEIDFSIHYQDIDCKKTNLSSKKFWTSLRNKFLFQEIFNFIGYDMISYFKLNSSVYSFFKLYLTKLPALMEFRDKLFESILPFNDFLTESTLLSQVLQMKEESYNNKEPHANENNLYRSTFFKILLIKKFYDNFIIELNSPLKLENTNLEKNIIFSKSFNIFRSIHIYFDREFYLSVISLTNCRINDNIVKIIVTYYKNLEKYYKVKNGNYSISLIFPKNNITNASLSEFSYLLYKDMLLELNLKENSLNKLDDHWSLLFQSIINCQNLEVVNFTGNKIPEREKITIKSFLSEIESLEFLEI